MKNLILDFQRRNKLKKKSRYYKMQVLFQSWIRNIQMVSLL